jgi:acetyl-CoA carboxylase beta subunit
MDMVSYLTGCLAGLVVIAIVKMSKNIIKKYKSRYVNEIYEFHKRYINMFCPKCRKLKKHKEVKPYLFQCVKCKRHTDLRAS